jgi:integrase
MKRRTPNPANEQPSTPKLRPKGSGAPEWRNGHWWVRVFLPDDTRPRYRLCGDVCECESMSEARRLDRCAAISERKRAEVTARMAADAKAQRAKRLTVQQFGEQWTSGKLLELHGEVNGLKEKASVGDDESRLKRYVYPEIGSTAVADVTEQDIERVLAAAPRRVRGKRSLRRASKYQLFQVVRRMFDLAIRPGRLRDDSPVSDYLKPGKDSGKLYEFLYPSDVLDLLRCTAIPVGRRVLYALAVYTGLRKGSLYALTWGRVDWQNGTLTSLRSKTGVTQVFSIDADLVEMLARWHAFQGRPPNGSRIVAGLDIDVKREHEATVLRDDLRAAGVTREDLGLSGDELPDNAQPIRFHDLRATFVTWAKRAGRGNGWIGDRTGHLTPEMVARYDRGARRLADLRYDPFPSLDKAIPELWEHVDNVRSIMTARGRER